MGIAMLNELILFELVNEPVPLRIDESGTLRVSHTRISLDLIIEAFHQGSTPEQIAARFTTLRLAEVYAVIAYYLQHQEVVDAYLRQRQQAAEEFRRHNPMCVEFRDLRNRLLKRRSEQCLPKDVKTAC